LPRFNLVPAFFRLSNRYVLALSGANADKMPPVMTRVTLNIDFVAAEAAPQKQAPSGRFL